MAKTMEEAFNEVIDPLDLEGEYIEGVLGYRDEIVMRFVPTVLWYCLSDSVAVPFKDGVFYLGEEGDWEDYLYDNIDISIGRDTSILWDWLKETRGMGINYYVENVGQIVIRDNSNIEMKFLVYLFYCIEAVIRELLYSAEERGVVKFSRV